MDNRLGTERKGLALLTLKTVLETKIKLLMSMKSLYARKLEDTRCSIEENETEKSRLQSSVQRFESSVGLLISQLENTKGKLAEATEREVELNSEKDVTIAGLKRVEEAFTRMANNEKEIEDRAEEYKQMLLELEGTCTFENTTLPQKLL